MEDAKKILKRLEKKAIKKLVFSKATLIILIIVAIFVMVYLFGVYLFNLFEGVFREGDLKNVPYAASTYTNEVTISSEGLTTKMTAQELWDSMIENGSNVKKYLKSPEELEKLMKAEIVTQNPKIGKGDLDGIIEFKRRKTDKSVIDLKYVDEETFNSYIDAYNANGDETALGYYTIDANGNALIAQWTKITKTVDVSVEGGYSNSETTTTYSMTSSMINYKSVVQKYSMPFDYLWALLITTNGKKFVLELADYVIEDSSIDITGIENYSTATDVETFSEQISVTVPVTVKDPKTGKITNSSRTESRTKTTTITTTIETNNVNADLTKADTWIIDYKKDENGNGTPKFKVDKDSNERNFVTILNKYYYTKQNLNNNALMLFDILERNTSTANMVDLTKYLINKVENKKIYNVEEKDIYSEYEDNTFENYSSYYGDYVVKTNDSNSAPVIKDKAELEKGLKKWLKTSTNMKSNALSVLDTVFECQEKYHVNAVFTYAFLRKETGIGTANTNYVNVDNNWGSWLLGHKYSSPADNIITITSKIESGNIYFTKGNITVSKIGAIYCPNDSKHPTQGDDWISGVTNFMSDLYTAMGITPTVRRRKYSKWWKRDNRCIYIFNR